MLSIYVMIRHSFPTILASEIKAVKKVISSSWLAQGRMVNQFEKALAKYIGVKYALATNSGTSALHLVLLSLGVKPNDEVILPSYVCTAVLNAVNYIGARAVLADINEQDFNLGLSSVKRRLTRRTKAIILPYLFGYAADVKGLLSLGVPIIEDCAQSLGASYQGQKLGSFGTAAIFSFYATKMITTGYGGMIVTNNRDLINRARDLREFDERNNYIIRYNYQMSDFQAALGLVQLKKLAKFIHKRQKLARFYDRQLSALNGRVLFLRKPREDETPACYRYVIRLKKIKIVDFIRQMAEKKIEIKRPVYRPLHHYLGLSRKEFPVTEQVYQSAVSLPIYPKLTMTQARYLIREVQRYFQERISL